MSSFTDRFVAINNIIRETVSSAFDGQNFTISPNGAIDANEGTALLINDADVRIDNAGTIAGAFNGVSFVDGGDDALLLNSGTISSDSRAINVAASGVEINNSGTIIATSSQRNGTLYLDDSADVFTLQNSGVIDAGIGLEGAAVSIELAEAGSEISINNSGQIFGAGNAGAGSTQAGDGIRLERTRVDGNLDGSTTGLFTGEISNSGLISSEAANGTVAGFRAVNGVSFQGTLNNDGLIAGVQNGVYFGNATPAGGGDHTGGVVNNSGTISSDSRAFNIDGTGLEVNNFGTIIATSSQRNGTVYADSTAQDFTLNNFNLIDAGIGLEGAGFSVELSEGGNDFTINNSGQIFGAGNAGAGSTQAGDGIRLERTRVDGNLDGSTTGLFTGEITNSGLISSEAANGTVGGFRTVNGVSFQGTLTNNGTIDGNQNGVYFGNATPAGGGDHTGGVVNNNGTISSNSRAFNIDGTGLEINNVGTIIATSSQRNGTVYADSTAQDFTLNNSGLIDAGIGLEGAGFSVELSEAGNTFTINNSGQIFGAGNAGAGSTQAGDGIRLERSRVDGNLDGSTTGLFDGLIVNSGLIAADNATNGTVAGFRAVNGVSFQGTLLNEAGGTITGIQNGVYFGNATPAGGADNTGGLVVNEGLISSGSRAFNVDGSGLAVVNQGVILGTGDQRNGTFYADATADDYVFVNGVSGVVDAGQGNNGSAVALQVGDNVSALVVNDGLLQGQGNSTTANGTGHGLRLFPGAGADSTFDGAILNFGTIAGSNDSNSAAGVSIEGVELTGVVVNFGTIVGNEVGIDASAANGVNILNGGAIFGDVLLSGGNDVFVLTSNGFVDGQIEGGAGFDTLSLVGFSDSEANALLSSGNVSGFENVVFNRDFGFNEFVSSASDIAFFDGNEDFVNDANAANDIDLLAEIATIEADFDFGGDTSVEFAVL